MLVADLQEHLMGVRERSFETTLGQISVSEDAARVRLNESGEEFPLDESTEATLGQYLGIPKGYLNKSPAELKAINFNYWLNKNSGSATVIESSGQHITAVHKPGLLILPLHRVAEVITSTIDNSYEIVNLKRDATKFHIDIITPHTVEVPVDERIVDRQQGDHAVGDITHGGIRILSNPTEATAPRVLTYLHRLWCMNGATSPESEGVIRLRGNTVDEVFMEMEEACRRVMGDLDTKLAEYASLATKYPPGTKDAFARQLGLEYGIPAKHMRKILDRVQQLPADATLYDIQQVFTAYANEPGVPYGHTMTMQTIGGDLAFKTDAVTHRCNSCERLLP